MKRQIWTLLGLGAALTVSTTAPAQAGILGLSEQEEIQAGRQVAQQAIREHGGAMPSNHPYSIRVRTLGQRFAALSTRKNVPYTYTVLNDNKTLNAFAAPGGPIFVTRKLLETTANDAELAYVLGHETAHIDRRHIVEQVEKQQKAGLVVGVLGAILGRRGGSAGNAIGTIANVGWTVLSRGYSRDHENESDTVGVRWMSQLGFDPRASVSMLGKLGGGSGGGLDKYLSTHPAPKDRQARMTQLIQKENLLSVATRMGGPRLSAGFDTGANYGGATNASYPGTYPGGSTTNDGGAYPGAAVPENSDGYYPPTDGTPGYTDNGEVNWGAPLRVWDLGNGRGTVLAPVRGFATWASARLTSTGRATTLTRGNSRLVLDHNSTVASLNGRTVTMSAPAQIVNGVLYAPLGHLVAAANARAEIEAGTGLIRLQLDGRSAGFVRIPQS
ncbi:MAG TPA: M48 family metalloprotease [Abditibacteriaceae bacterium]|jgi:Zn-dependent protease with chaperone function